MSSELGVITVPADGGVATGFGGVDGPVPGVGLITFTTVGLDGPPGLVDVG